MFPESFIDDDFNFYSEIIIIKERMEGRNFDFHHFSQNGKNIIYIGSKNNENKKKKNNKRN